jgi:hypothetical protein
MTWPFRHSDTSHLRDQATTNRLVRKYGVGYFLRIIKSRYDTLAAGTSNVDGLLPEDYKQVAEYLYLAIDLIDRKHEGLTGTPSQ